MNCCLITAPVFWSKHSRALAPRSMYGLICAEFLFSHGPVTQSSSGRVVVEWITARRGTREILASRAQG